MHFWYFHARFSPLFPFVSLHAHPPPNKQLSSFNDIIRNKYYLYDSRIINFSYIKYNGDIKYQPKSNDGTSVYPPFNAFSKNAKVSGTVVYVNYGTVEDFDKLLDLEVDLTDRIALCRYGKIFRGSKV